MRRNLGEEHLHGMLHLLFMRFIVILLDIKLEGMYTVLGFVVPLGADQWVNLT